MPLNRFGKLDADRQRRLLGAAAQEFAAHGFEGASLARMTDGAGMSKASIYYYFQDKADLFATTVREAWRTLVSEVPAVDVEALDAASFWPALRGLHRAVLARCRREPWLVAASKLTHRPDGAGAVAPVVAELVAEGEALRKRILRRGQELGVVRTDLPEDLLLAIAAGADTAADRWILDRWDGLDPAEQERLALHVFEVVRGIVSPPADAAAGEPRP